MRRELLRTQFDLTWALADYHLDRVVAADLLWEPAPLTWTVRDGVPDWADTEPDPIPVPTIAWVTWHLGWWWTVALDDLHGRPLTPRESVTWPDDPVAWLRSLRTAWLSTLAEIDLERPTTFPAPGTAADTLAWANVELMKNVAELGQLRLLRAAGSGGAAPPPRAAGGPTRGVDVRLDLIVLYSEQVEACRDFYARLGLPFVEERHGEGPLHHAAVLADGTVVEIYPGSTGRTTGRLRLGLTVAATPDLPAGSHRLEDPDGRVVAVTAR